MADDIYAVIEGQENEGKGAEVSEQRPYDKDEYATRKKMERDLAYMSIDEATEKITKDPALFKEYLDVMARFPRYSVANTLLIFEQMPEATRLGSFDAWKSKGASVRKGQHAISILEPGDEYTRDDGTIGVSYNVRPVFDEWQTSARHTEPRHPEIRDLLLALIKDAPVTIKTVDELPLDKGSAVYDHESKTISVVKGLDEPALFKTLATELTHAALASKDEVYNYEANRETASLAGYVLSERYGVDNSGLVPILTSDRMQDGWSKEVRGELSRIRDAAKTISDRIDKTLDATREQNAAPKEKAQNRGDRDAR